MSAATKRGDTGAWYRFRWPRCACEHALASHKPWGLQRPCMEMDGFEPCLCMDYSPAEPEDVRDDDGFESEE